MLVQIDEAGSYHQSGGIDFRSCFERRSGNRGDLRAVNSNVANGVQPGFWVQHPSTAKNDVICLCEGRVSEDEEADK